MQSGCDANTNQIIKLKLVSVCEVRKGSCPWFLFQFTKLYYEVICCPTSAQRLKDWCYMATIVKFR